MKKFIQETVVPFLVLLLLAAIVQWISGMLFANCFIAVVATIIFYADWEKTRQPSQLVFLGIMWATFVAVALGVLSSLSTLEFILLAVGTLAVGKGADWAAKRLKH